MNLEESKYKTKLWEFIRGDLSASEFEKWCYTADGLEKYLGSELYLSVIDIDHKNSWAVFDLIKKLRKWVEINSPNACYCCTFKNNEVSTLGDKFIMVEGKEKDYRTHFEVLKSRSKWVELLRCKTCGEIWYVAFDTVDDDIYFKRINADKAGQILKNDKWPKDYDNMKSVW